MPKEPPSNLSEFFVGIVKGFTEKVPVLVAGATRTKQTLGFGVDEDVRQEIILHNRLTWLAVKYSWNFMIGTHPDPRSIPLIWNSLPPDTQDRITNHSFNFAGQMVGGQLVSAGINQILTRGLMLPRRIVTPGIFFLSIYGQMGLIWKDIK